MRIPDTIQRELDRIPGRWKLEERRRHLQITVDGKIVGLIPKGAAREQPRSQLNIRARIRRAIEGRGV